MSVKTFKPLPKGTEVFASLREDGCYYVDKTPYLKSVFTDTAAVQLFTRPRRFGKTLLMDMFATFLTIAEDGSSGRERKEKLFEGLEILKDKGFTDKYMGQFPVIFISLKSVFGENFNDAYGKLAELVAGLGEQFSFLKDSAKISKEQKEVLSILKNQVTLQNPDYSFILTGALKTYSNCLYKHYGKKVILLIDEYDVPLAKASEKGYHSQMVTLICQFFDVMKMTPNNKNTEYPIEKIVLTGCLKVAKNSIFTGVNNLSVNTVLSEDPDFDSIIGFTKDETLRFLQDYELLEYADMVKNNYDGYRFNKKEMFCPWDVVNFINEALKKKASGEQVIPGNYWINSTSSNALLTYVGYLSDRATEKMQSLMDGQSIETDINDSMNYDTLSKHDERDFFSLLLHTGYLTVDSYRIDTIGDDVQVIYSLKIPNREIRKCFEYNIVEHFKEKATQGENRAMIIANALFCGDCDTAKTNIRQLLRGYVSVRDFATKAKPENFYHGFLSGLFTNLGNSISEFRTNSESGDGYADIILKNENEDTIAVIEIKSSRSDDDFLDDTKKALEQIERNSYYEPYLKKVNIKNIYCYGISFYKKDCYIECVKAK
ncbi:MAG: AAA family ATPase [Succinivibrio sp.]